jgi:pimeloyl-ACP methyl ester carboxylesterase
MRSSHWAISAGGAFLVAVLGASLAVAAIEPAHGTFTASDGVKIHYLEAGKGSPVVLVHGYTGSAQGNWFSNGVAEALAKNHRVVAIDCRGHGQSDKPHDSAKYGPQMAKDVVELMDHLKIDKAHVHGYSMGGGIVTQLLAGAPERFITASYGGSGVQEIDEKYKAEVPQDKPGPDPQEEEARKKLAAAPNDREALAAVRGSWNPSQRGRIDLTKIRIPVLAINGEFDGPNAKTHRMKRELANFRAVVLPGKSHLTAIMAGYIPHEYIDELVKFIDANDKRE